MTRSKAAVLVALLVVAVGAAGWVWWSGTGQAGALPPPAQEVDDALSRANLDFSFRLLDGLWQKQGDEADNLFVSPTSISMALSMTLQGAAGETHGQMARVLGVSDLESGRVNRGWGDLKTILQNPDPDIQLSIANSIWAREGEPFRQEFLDVNRSYYGAEVQQLDFLRPEASDTINSWVEDETGGKITDIIDEHIDPQTIMFLINAIHFDGQWQHEFDAGLTEEDTFYRSEDDAVQVPFMRQSEELMYLWDDRLQGVALPFGEGRVSMYVLLPDAESSPGELVSRLDGQSWRSLIDSFYPAGVQLTMPRFSLESDLSLKPVLESLGMQHAFDPGLADFSRLHPAAPDESVWVHDVKHKSFLEVNEEGAEAAAATSVEIRMESALPAEQMTVDRPFIFAIYDDLTDTMLFAGWLVDPSGG